MAWGQRVLSDGVMEWWSDGSRLFMHYSSTPALQHSVPPAFSQFLCHLFHRVALNIVADEEVAEALDANAAFHTGPDLVDLILKAAERLSRSEEQTSELQSH